MLYTWPSSVSLSLYNTPMICGLLFTRIWVGFLRFLLLKTFGPVVIYPRFPVVFSAEDNDSTGHTQQMFEEWTASRTHFLVCARSLPSVVFEVLHCGSMTTPLRGSLRTGYHHSTETVVLLLLSSGFNVILRYSITAQLMSAQACS